MYQPRQPSKALQVFCSTHLGDSLGLSFCGWDHTTSQVWQVQTKQHMYYLKYQPQHRKYHQELHAYLHWLPYLRPWTAELIAYSDSLQSLLITAVEGRRISDKCLPQDTALQIFEQAGRFLTKLHHLPYEDHDPLPYQEAIELRYQHWQVQFNTILPDINSTLIEQHLARIKPSLKNAQRVPTHRDFSPRNWLLNKHQVQQLHVIDFEHSLPDYWLQDLVKLSTHWHQNYALKAAFMKGYAYTLNETEQDILDFLIGFNALITIAWARKHRDIDLEQHGRQAYTQYLQSTLKKQKAVDKTPSL